MSSNENVSIGKADTGQAGTEQARKMWHYLPGLPIQVSPYFRKPFNLGNAIKWIFSSWFPVSDRLVVLGLAILSWIFFHPEIEACKDFALTWIAQIYTRNLILMILVAGGLHLYLYVWKKQGDELRYDNQAPAKSHSEFTFKSQIKDNVFWTIASGVTIWTAYEVLMMWAMANGYMPMLSFAEDWPWIFLLIFLVPIWETFYFFGIHR